MAKQIFDQARPKSIMAQQLDEAFAGCDQWTVVAAPRRSSIDFSPRASSSSRMIGRAAAVRTQEPARAVVVGVVQEEDVPGAGPGPVVLRAIEAGVARRVQSLPHCDHSTGRQPRLRTARRPTALKIP